MGVDYTCLFPTPMLSFGLHPQVEVEVALSRGYNRWLCERVLAERAAADLAALPAVQRSGRMLQDGEGVRRQEGRRRLPRDRRALQRRARQRIHEDLCADRGDGQAARVPRRLQLAEQIYGADEPVHLGPCARLSVLQHPAHDEPRHQRHLRALPEAEDHVDRGRHRLGAVPDAAARQRIHDAASRKRRCSSGCRANTWRSSITPPSRSN